MANMSDQPDQRETWCAWRVLSASVVMVVVEVVSVVVMVRGNTGYVAQSLCSVCVCVREREREWGGASSEAFCCLPPFSYNCFWSYEHWCYYYYYGITVARWLTICPDNVHSGQQIPLASWRSLFGCFYKKSDWYYCSVASYTFLINAPCFRARQSNRTDK